MISKTSESDNKKDTKYKSINNYKPNGNLIYDDELINKMKI